MTAAVPAADRRTAELGDALDALRRRLTAAATAASRNTETIQLLPVTKFFPASDIAILANLGCRIFGESRDQEATEKIAELASLEPPVAWHMVGRIQRNKARSVAKWADAVHSADSVRLIDALERGAEEALADGLRTRPLGVFVQISLDGDTSRGGVPVSDSALVDAVCARAAEGEALKLAGLMGIPPLGADADEAFERLADEHRRVVAMHPDATGLSAGMSGDLEAAVKHGSTCVRVGTALLGQRPLPSP